MGVRRRDAPGMTPDADEALIYRSATQLAAAICTKQVSAEELVRAHLHRIEVVNPRLNAVVQIADAVLWDARAA